MMEELGRGDTSVRGIVSVSLGLVGKTILKHGSEEQRQEWLPRLCAGEILGCFGLTEPDTGSDAGSLKSRAVRDGAGPDADWLISGTKIFITNGTWAEVALIFARTGEPGPKGVTAFLVPTDAPGFGASSIHGKLGLRAQSTAELTLDQVRVPDRNRLGELGEGFPIAMSALEKGRISVAAGCVGLAQGCLNVATAYAKEREQFGKPIGVFQAVSHPLATTYMELELARSLALWAAWSISEGDPQARVAAAAAKAQCAEAAVAACERSIQAHGGIGFTWEHVLHRLYKRALWIQSWEASGAQLRSEVAAHILEGA